MKEILLRKRASPLPLEKWKGFCRDSGFRPVDRFIDDIRGDLGARQGSLGVCRVW